MAKEKKREKGKLDTKIIFFILPTNFPIIFTKILPPPSKKMDVEGVEGKILFVWNIYAPVRKINAYTHGEKFDLVIHSVRFLPGEKYVGGKRA